MTADRSTILKAIGPGLLFAGAAIGVSHLVQSTQAGATYGLLLIPVVLLAHALKLPALLAGPRYAAATGRTLIDAYLDQGRHATITFALITFGTMFTIQAAVSIVCGAVINGAAIKPLLGEPLPTWFATACVMGLCATILALGGFKWLDRVIKVLMLVMLIATLAATLSILPRIEFEGAFETPATQQQWGALIVFAVALFGWMPAPLDIAVWNSVWTLERKRLTSSSPSRRACETDFFIGYALCIVLALGFLLLGDVLMHQRGIAPASSGPAVAAQIIDLYTGAIGEWVRPLISVCAIAVMLSTCLTVQDALPRTAVLTVHALQGKHASIGQQAGNNPKADHHEKPEDFSAGSSRYWIAQSVVVAGGMGVVLIALDSPNAFRRLISLAMILSFCSAPILAWFNHRAMISQLVGDEFREGRAWRIASWTCLAGLTAFAGIFVWTQVS